MGWHIHLVKNTVSINSEIALALWNCDAQVCFAWKEECNFPMLEGIIYDGKLVFNSDHLEHMDYVWEPEVLEVLCRFNVKGEICFTSHDGDNAGQSWGYYFDGQGNQYDLTRGEGGWEETGTCHPRGKGVLTCNCGGTDFKTIGRKNGPPRDKCLDCGKFDKTRWVHPFPGGKTPFAAVVDAAPEAKKPTKRAKADWRPGVRSALDNEGFHYCFNNYSDFKEVKDKKFHQLRKAYLAAAEALQDYIGVEE